MTTLQMLLMVATVGQKEAGEVSLQAMQSRAAGTRLSLVNAPTKPLKLVNTPVFRYSDQLRHIEDAGIWIWTDSGRPVSAMKVEYYQLGQHPRPWLYCFTSLSEDLVVAEWDGETPFRAKQPGVKWQPLPDKPADTRASRLLQMRDYARRFSAELIRRNEQEERSQMRLLTRPLYRYEESAESATDGALFGFTGTGTNPDLLLLLDLSPEQGWRFGLAGMSAEGLVVRLGEQVVWQIPHSAGKGQVFDNWTYFLPLR